MTCWIVLGHLRGWALGKRISPCGTVAASGGYHVAHPDCSLGCWLERGWEWSPLRGTPVSF
jgi:hypothetical protein